MADDDAPGPAQGRPEGQPGEQPQPQMRIVRQYLRDLSFENVGLDGGGAPPQQPQIAVNVALDAKKAGEGAHLVALKVTATAKVDEATVFLAEVDYAGVFELKNVPPQQLHPFLMIECPRFLFPFARRIVSDVTRDGGYPPLMIDNVDFLRLYRAELERRQAEADRAGGGGGERSNGPAA